MTSSDLLLHMREVCSTRSHENFNWFC